MQAELDDLRRRVPPSPELDAGALDGRGAADQPVRAADADPLPGVGEAHLQGHWTRCSRDVGVAPVSLGTRSRNLVTVPGVLQDR